MGLWVLQDAKARLSDMVDAIRRYGPQIITRRGVEEVLVMPEQCRQMNRKPLTLLEAVRSESLLEIDLPPRGRLLLRKPRTF